MNRRHFLTSLGALAAACVMPWKRKPVDDVWHVGECPDCDFKTIAEAVRAKPRKTIRVCSCHGGKYPGYGVTWRVKES